MQGASPRELLLEASRRNNTSLLTEVLTSVGPGLEKIAEFLNTVTDAVGAYALHLAAASGSYDTLDLLLDQAGVEVDPVDRLDWDTPLHKAVMYINGLSKAERDGAVALVQLLLDAGADPRVRNRAEMTPLQLVDPNNDALKEVLRAAEITELAAWGFTDAVDGGVGGSSGSASDSD
ncbi:MAG: hypothetical protein Q9163_005711 [Psora crenata]